jgi:hypothetical protein
MSIQKRVSLMLLSFLLFSCGDDNNKDMQKPEIRVDFPQNCIMLQRGQSFVFHAHFSDNVELGNYNIEVHNNFDHHSHNTGNVECEMDARKSPVNAWVFNQAYAIPAGQKTFEANNPITIPADIDTGDYHFMVRLTDQSGWQELAAVSIKVTE